jgi:hypothetical protein
MKECNWIINKHGCGLPLTPTYVWSLRASKEPDLYCKSLFMQFCAQVNIQWMIGNVASILNIFKLLNNYFVRGYHLFALCQVVYTGIRPNTPYRVAEYVAK